MPIVSFLLENNMIPSGMYCYDKNGICPHFTEKDIGGVKITWCSFLENGSAGGITDDDFDKLKSYLGVTDSELFDKYSLDLLWDQVKHCGENEDFE